MWGNLVMQKNNIGKAMRQVNELLKYIPLEQKNKINIKFLNLLNENEDKTYDFKIDPEKEIKDGDLLHETELLLLVIYRNYWCTEEEKKELDETLLENNKKYYEEINKKYSYENLFINNKPKKEDVEKVEETPNLPVVYENKNIFTKIISFIKNIFKKERKI